MRTRTRHMGITEEELKALQSEHFAEDVPIPPDATGWTAVEAEAYFSSGGEERPAPKGANGSGNTAAVPRTYPAYVEPQPAPGESREAFLAKMRSIPWWGGGDECEACGGSGKAAPAGVFRWLVDISGEFQDRICALCLALH